MQCESCKAKWELQNNQKVTNCPFCQAPLASEMPQVPPNSNEAKILQIVKDRGPGIYLKKEFIGLVLDYFPNDEFGLLLKKTIENKGAVYVSKLKDYPADEIQANYVKILDKLERESFILKETLTPAVELLCFGLGYSVTLPATQAPAPLAPATQASPISDFEIENGVLIKYIGKDSVVVIPNSVTSIGEWAFENCTSLSQVTIPNLVTSIGAVAFAKCTSLSQVTIPNSVTSIGASAFYECTSLSQVTIPNSVTSIGDCAFQLTPWYNNLSEKFNIFVAGILIKYCGDDSQVTIPNSVTSIGDFAFRQCTSLSQVTIPNSVTSIGKWAFTDCSKLPKNVVEQIKKIDPDAL